MLGISSILWKLSSIQNLIVLCLAWLGFRFIFFESFFFLSFFLSLSLCVELFRFVRVRICWNKKAMASQSVSQHGILYVHRSTQQWLDWSILCPYARWWWYGSSSCLCILLIFCIRFLIIFVCFFFSRIRPMSERMSVCVEEESSKMQRIPIQMKRIKWIHKHVYN